MQVVGRIKKKNEKSAAKKSCHFFHVERAGSLNGCAVACELFIVRAGPSTNLRLRRAHVNCRVKMSRIAMRVQLVVAPFCAESCFT